MGPVLSFAGVGALELPDLLPADVHIFTASRRPWGVLPPQIEACLTRQSPGA